MPVSKGSGFVSMSCFRPSSCCLVSVLWRSVHLFSTGKGSNQLVTIFIFAANPVCRILMLFYCLPRVMVFMAFCEELLTVMGIYATVVRTMVFISVVTTASTQDLGLLTNYNE